MAESKKYRPLVIAASVLVPVVVAILFTVRIPDAEPLTFLPPIYAGINALTSLLLIAALYFIKNGGWHFTCLRTAEDLEKKLLNFAHHYEYEESGLNIDGLKKLISEKRVMYDHKIDQKGYKWSGKSILKNFDKKLLPKYVQENLEKYSDWLD